MSQGEMPDAGSRLDARKVLEGYAAGALSPVEVTKTVLQKIDRLNGELGAFVVIDHDGALRAAKQSERKWLSWRQDNTPAKNPDWQKLPSWGVPISVKDTIELEGFPTTYGSLAFTDNFKPDSQIVSTLRRAGCVILGKTNTSEFALSMVTATRVAPPARNPYDGRRTPGGSSGGAAAAAAAGLGTFSLGTDSVGSIRQPAAYCGLYGLKPTTGRVKNRQAWRASPVRSHLGPLASDVNDLLYSWRVLTGDGEPLRPFEKAELPRPLRVAVVSNDPDDGSVLAAGLDILRQSGVEETGERIEIDEPPGVHSLGGDWIFAADHYAAAESLVRGFMDKHREKLCRYTQEVYDTGNRIPAWEYRRLMAAIDDYRLASQAMFDRADLILTSVADAPPMLDDTGNLDDRGPEYPLLSVWNLAGNPALTLPLKLGKDGLPRAVQLVARQGEDRLLLRLALSFSQVNGRIAPAR